MLNDFPSSVLLNFLKVAESDFALRRYYSDLPGPLPLDVGNCVDANPKLRMLKLRVRDPLVSRPPSSTIGDIQLPESAREPLGEVVYPLKTGPLLDPEQP